MSILHSGGNIKHTNGKGGDEKTKLQDGGRRDQHRGYAVIVKVKREALHSFPERSVRPLMPCSAWASSISVIRTHSDVDVFRRASFFAIAASHSRWVTQHTIVIAAIAVGF